MNELTRITHTPTGGFTIVTGWGATLAEKADRLAALRALFHRGFTPEGAVASLNAAVRLGELAVKGLVAD